MSKEFFEQSESSPDDWRGRERQTIQQAMNHALASVLRALGYPVRLFGTGGASLITGSRRPSPATTRRSTASRGRR
jgi:hypothetical protein